MANINFSPEISTNKIYRDTDTTRCLTDDLDSLEQNKANASHTHTQYSKLSHTHSNYSLSNHTHTGYATSDHVHNTADVEGLDVALASKAASSHTHNYAAATHTHQQSSISGLTNALNNKANVDHTHAGTMKITNSEIINATGSSSFTGTINPEFEAGCTYLVSIKYVSAAGLVDQSLYSVYYDPSATLIPTYNLVKCEVGSDSLLLRKTSSGITYVLSLTSSNSATVTGANIKIL